MLATLTAAVAVAMAAAGSVWLVRWAGDLGSAAPTWPQRTPFLGGGVPETHAWSRFHAPKTRREAIEQALDAEGLSEEGEDIGQHIE